MVDRSSTKGRKLTQNYLLFNDLSRLSTFFLVILSKEKKTKSKSTFGIATEDQRHFYTFEHINHKNSLD